MARRSAHPCRAVRYPFIGLDKDLDRAARALLEPVRELGVVESEERKVVLHVLLPDFGIQTAPRDLRTLDLELHHRHALEHDLRVPVEHAQRSARSAQSK